MLGLALNRWSPAEVEERRQQLSRVGYQAYCVPIIGIVFIYAFRTLAASSDSSKNGSRGTKNSGSGLVQGIYRRLHWLLTSTYAVEYGPVYLVLLSAIYAGILSWLIVSPTIAQTGKADYLHLSKALGHVAVSQLPFLYLLAVKSPSSPIAVATGLTHERLNVVHRLLARIIYTALCGHALLYLNLFVTMKVLAKRLKGIDVIAGLSALATFTILATLAQPLVRKKWYHAGFYRVHVMASALLLAIVWIHVPYTRIYVAQAAFIWVASAISRRGHGSAGWSESAIVTCRDVGSPTGDLLEVTASIEGLTGKKRWLESWVPGMHGYINRGIIGPKVPFTVVDVEAGKGGSKAPVQVKMVVKNLRGPTTSLLGSLAKGEKPLPCSLEGPYGEAKEYIPPLIEAGASAGKILIVAGGVGATYALPVYTALQKARHGNSDGLRLIWVVKRRADAHWGVERLRKLNGSVDVQIITTQAESNANGKSQTGAWQDIAGLSFSHQTGRPDFRTLLSNFVHDQSGKATVMVCGPTSLSQSLRTAVGRHVLKHGSHIDWHEEQFGFGGS